MQTTCASLISYEITSSDSSPNLVNFEDKISINNVLQLLCLSCPGKRTLICTAEDVMGAAITAFTMERNAKFQVDTSQSRGTIDFYFYFLVSGSELNIAFT